MTSLADEEAVYSPGWWEDLNTSLSVIDKSLKVLDSQFRRCYAYRTKDHSSEDIELVKRAFYMISDIRKDIAPLIKWSENSAALCIGAVSESERAFIRVLMNRIAVYTSPAYRSWMVSMSEWMKMNFHVLMNKIVVDTTMLNSVQQHHVETTTKQIIKEMHNIRLAWSHAWSK